MELGKADPERERKLGDVFGNDSDNENSEDISESDQSDNESEKSDDDDNSDNESEKSEDDKASMTWKTDEKDKK